MSYETLNWAWNQRGLTSSKKFILVALADMADESNSCYPGQEKLAEMTGCSVSTVRRSLRELEEAGAFTRVQRRRDDGYRTSDRFFLNLSYRSECTVNSHRSFEGPHRSLTHDLTGHGDGVTPSKNPQKNPQELIPAFDVDLLFDEAWKAWPKKVDKKDARAKFKRVCERNPWKGNEHALVDVIVQHGEAHARFTPKQFVPGLAVWLNKERWDNPLPERRSEGVRLSTVEQGRQVDAILRAREGGRKAVAS